MSISKNISFVAGLLIAYCSNCYAVSFAEVIEQDKASSKKQSAAKVSQLKSKNKEKSSSSDSPKKLSLKERAFRQMLNKKLPLSPKQISRYKKTQEDFDRAAATPTVAPPKAVSSNINVDLSPGSANPVIRLSQGFVSSLVFIDSTGQPWPVADYSLGDPKNFNIQWDKKTNTMFIQSTSKYRTANLAVRLVKLKTPIMLTLVTNQKEVDFRADLQVAARGPNAEAPVVDNSFSSSSPNRLMGVLDGIAPEHGVELKVNHHGSKAWQIADRIILRTKLTLLSPAWSNKVSSVDGTYVYELEPTSSIVASEQGNIVNVTLQEL